MKIIVCLDERNGMMFNHRRLSQDVMVRRDILKNMNGRKLFMNNYSYQMFKDDEFIKNIYIEENMPLLNDEYQFIEDKPLIHYAHDIQQIVIYYWNRRYPSDVQFDIDINDGNWRLLLDDEIVGNSHDKITKRIFERITKK
ncbi:MAG: hypothetical protein RR585_09655 [Coprobacillus sp.]